MKNLKTFALNSQNVLLAVLLATLCWSSCKESDDDESIEIIETAEKTKADASDEDAENPLYYELYGKVSAPMSNLLENFKISIVMADVRLDSTFSNRMGDYVLLCDKGETILASDGDIYFIAEDPTGTYAPDTVRMSDITFDFIPFDMYVNMLTNVYRGHVDFTLTQER